MRNRQLKQQIISIFFIIFVFVVSLSSIDSGSVLLSKNGMDQPQLLLGAPYHEPDILSEGKIQNIRNTDVSSAKSSSRITPVLFFSVLFLFIVQKHFICCLDFSWHHTRFTSQYIISYIHNLDGRKR